MKSEPKSVKNWFGYQRKLDQKQDLKDIEKVFNQNETDKKQEPLTELSPIKKEESCNIVPKFGTVNCNPPRIFSNYRFGFILIPIRPQFNYH